MASEMGWLEIETPAKYQPSTTTATHDQQSAIARPNAVTLVPIYKIQVMVRNYIA
jgi:hypothetical protein